MGRSGDRKELESGMRFDEELSLDLLRKRAVRAQVEELQLQVGSAMRNLLEFRSCENKQAQGGGRRGNKVIGGCERTVVWQFSWSDVGSSKGPGVDGAETSDRPMRRPSHFLL